MVQFNHVAEGNRLCTHPSSSLIVGGGSEEQLVKRL